MCDYGANSSAFLLWMPVKQTAQPTVHSHTCAAVGKHIQSTPLHLSIAPYLGHLPTNLWLLIAVLPKLQIGSLTGGRCLLSVIAHVCCVEQLCSSIHIGMCWQSCKSAQTAGAVSVMSWLSLCYQIVYSFMVHSHNVMLMHL